jgi:2',3'-cyclic-nucleotide 2'-phosphodiesterase (5'-nucleotidase family)
MFAQGVCPPSLPAALQPLQAQGADLVVALTHMRVPNDRLLAASVPGIDLVSIACLQ